MMPKMLESLNIFKHKKYKSIIYATKNKIPINQKCTQYIKLI